MLLTPDILQRLSRVQLLLPRLGAGLQRTGLHRSRRRGAALEFDQFRNYAPGDDIRQLDWHSLARRDELLIRVQSQETTGRLALLLDASASMHFVDDAADKPISKFQYAAVLAEALAFVGSRQYDELGLFAYGGGSDMERKCVTSQCGFSGFCKALEGLSPGGAGDAAGAVEECCAWLKRSGRVLWISDFLNDETQLLRQLRMLQAAGQGCTAIQILTPAERTFPFEAARRFADPEKRLPFVDAIPEQARQEYLRSFEEHQQRLQKIFDRAETPFLQQTTCDDLLEIVAHC